MYSWVSPKIEIKNTGNKGRGMFAAENIAKDEIITIAGGRIVPLEQFDTDPTFEPIRYHGFQIEKDFVICPFDVDNMVSVFLTNHSCDPTCGIRGQVSIVAMKDIGVGEEITFDYAMTDTCEVSMDCHCGSPDCRKVITGDDWKRKDLREKYKGYFSNYVQKLIDAGA